MPLLVKDAWVDPSRVADLDKWNRMTDQGKHRSVIWLHQNDAWSDRQALLEIGGGKLPVGVR
ncbi:MAG: hypothetical protein Fur005_03780 [Roseiflexaceae bacterium]